MIINFFEDMDEEIVVKKNDSLELISVSKNKNKISLLIKLEDNAVFNAKFLALGSNEIKIKIIHEGKNSESNITSNNIVNENITFVAKTVIEEEAINCKAKQQINSLLLNPEAKVTNLPILDIKNNEVECSHGTSIGTLDEELLYYMRSRGLNCKEAKQAIIKGYINPFMKKLNEQQQIVLEKVIK